MKKLITPKLLVLTVLSALFMYTSSHAITMPLTADPVRVDNEKGKPQSKAQANSEPAVTKVAEIARTDKSVPQGTKVTGRRVELDYWIRWRNQFNWNLPGNGSTFLLPLKSGC